jgi:hypothetical protein
MIPIPDTSQNWGKKEKQKKPLLPWKLAGDDTF